MHARLERSGPKDGGTGETHWDPRGASTLLPGARGSGAFPCASDRASWGVAKTPRCAIGMARSQPIPGIGSRFGPYFPCDHVEPMPGIGRAARPAQDPAMMILPCLRAADFEMAPLALSRYLAADTVGAARDRVETRGICVAATGTNGRKATAACNGWCPNRWDSAASLLPLAQTGVGVCPSCHKRLEKLGPAATKPLTRRVTRCHHGGRGQRRGARVWMGEESEGRISSNLRRISRLSGPRPDRRYPMPRSSGAPRVVFGRAHPARSWSSS
jgi:hypothetical protein